jgi:hypothetical protein
MPAPSITAVGTEPRQQSGQQPANVARGCAAGRTSLRPGGLLAGKEDHFPECRVESCLRRRSGYAARYGAVRATWAADCRRCLSRQLLMPQSAALDSSHWAACRGPWPGLYRGGCSHRPQRRIATPGSGSGEGSGIGNTDERLPAGSLNGLSHARRPTPPPASCGCSRSASPWGGCVRTHIPCAGACKCPRYATFSMAAKG